MPSLQSKAGGGTKQIRDTDSSCIHGSTNVHQILQLVARMLTNGPAEHESTPNPHSAESVNPRSQEREVGVRAGLTDWTREESSWRSSTWSVSLSRALLCCCRSLESAPASPAGAAGPPSAATAAAAVSSTAAPIASIRPALSKTLARKIPLSRCRGCNCREGLGCDGALRFLLSADTALRFVRDRTWPAHFHFYCCRGEF